MTWVILKPPKPVKKGTIFKLNSVAHVTDQREYDNTMSNISAQLGSLPHPQFWCEKYPTCGPQIQTMKHDLTDMVCQKTCTWDIG